MSYVWKWLFLVLFHTAVMQTNFEAHVYSVEWTSALAMPVPGGSVDRASRAGGSSRCRNPGLMLGGFSVWVATSVSVVTEAKRLQICARWRPPQVPCKQLQLLLRDSALTPQSPLLYQSLGARDCWGLSCLSILFCRARKGNLCCPTARSAFWTQHW